MDDKTAEQPPASPGTPKVVSQVPQSRVYDVNAADNQTKNTPVIMHPIILGDLTLGSPTTFTTIGANGAATALTANPVGYLIINVGNASYQIPYYNPA